MRKFQRSWSLIVGNSSVPGRCDANLWPVLIVHVGTKADEDRVYFDSVTKELKDTYVTAPGLKGCLTEPSESL